MVAGNDLGRSPASTHGGKIIIPTDLVVEDMEEDPGTTLWRTDPGRPPESPPTQTRKASRGGQRRRQRAQEYFREEECREE